MGANSYQVMLIAAAWAKTVKHDVWPLARLLVADLTPEVWASPVHVRNLPPEFPCDYQVPAGVPQAQ
ncbi:MAG: hypothetical protein JSV81_05140 [Anaerolineales bacterium]|nr:MAG: hypothetical protein JSV81_05140 [Anaerolineales bacterium]